MAAPMSIDVAVGAGDHKVVEQLLKSGADPNLRGADGMTPLAIASFWGYDTIVQLLIKNGADVNSSNKGTLWTPLHCAAFQGHGKVIMILLENKADLFKADAQGRTAVDFASAHDSIWAFFAAAGCKRTQKEALIKMNIVQKSTTEEISNQLGLLNFSNLDQKLQNETTHFSDQQTNNMIALTMGDVLAGVEDSKDQAEWDTRYNKPSFTVWNN
ncbi:ankyrin repeat protein PA3287 isoform X1 [Biomphalaria glabrata]|uniref:Ankyrin repeat protein PA3287 isoform X3 n=1 Tax=Biomphalaria glabrata TaxID=6526 RepID=A0A2C9LZ69_BIOGL|nr:putative ankyrin repeat protein PA3287 isoform X3 [Biomphalaria glabrata]KAI8742671.1 putative ankyrin repeat protein [Biomphalaria glabrata]KAI8772808.1 ankyrin repeat protein PA3287 isoform X1 [Biomphalaria glabrata]